MSKNIRQLDAWGIYRDPEHVYDALKIILGSKDKITEPLKLYKNCASRFSVDGEEIARYMSTVVYSEEADIVLFLSEAEKPKYFEYEDEYKDDGKYTVEVIATPDVIEAFFKKYQLPYEVIDFKDEQSKVNDNEIPETWFARESAVLVDSLTESADKLGKKECVFYNNIESKLSIGKYLEDGTFEEVWGSDFKGLVDTGYNWVLCTNEGDERNLDSQAVIETLKSENFEYIIDEIGRPEELNKILVSSKKGECPADTFMNYVRLCIEKKKEYEKKGEEVPKRYLKPETVYLSDESVRYFMESKLVDLIGTGEDGKQIQFYWKDSEELPALEVKLELDETKNQYMLTYIKEEEKGDYKGFEWKREEKEPTKDHSNVQIYRAEDEKDGIGER